MSRYIIEKHTNPTGEFTLHLVFLAQGYSDRWMKSSDGRSTIAYVVLEKMVADALQNRTTLQPTLFASYRQRLEGALYQRLVDIGKSEGAKQRVRQRAEEICATLKAIVVEESTGEVSCLNVQPHQPVATYDSQTCVVTVDDIKWTVIAAKKIQIVGGKGKEKKKEEGKKGHSKKRTHAGNDHGKISINNLTDWFAKNHFVIWTSLLMLVVVPACMIWGMLSIKELAEQSNQKPDNTMSPTTTTDSLKADTLKADTIIPEQLVADTVIPEQLVADTMRVDTN